MLAGRGVEEDWFADPHFQLACASAALHLFHQCGRAYGGIFRGEREENDLGPLEIGVES